uniref:Uncharacterized protein n=1 Tax=viral metagenome TaxID=1070528 RepID=A0A6C0BDQ7_9ZZZZ
MGAGTHGKTSTILYRRGVPNAFRDFGGVIAGNYVIFKPQRPLLNSEFFRRSISNFISTYR